MNKADKKAARQERIAEDKKTNKQALLAGLSILSMYGGFFAYFS